MVLVFAEHVQGVFRKKGFELVQYGAAIAQRVGGTCTALVLGPVEQGPMGDLGAYGAQQVLHVADDRLANFSARAAAKAVAEAVQKTGAKIIILPHDYMGRQIASRVAARLKAGLAAGVISHPDTSNGFVVRKSVFAGKAFADVSITSDIKVLTLSPNTFAVSKAEGTAPVEKLDVSFDEKDFGIQVKETKRQAAGTVPLSEAELVVSGGRGMKGPENWAPLEELASALGATLACSRPVADSHWRPHHEHVGQTGGTIRPNLYVAVGISGAIQHLAGVNASKTIVVINKDPEAPFFKAADYGIIGDAAEILPRLTASVRKLKESQS
jgi:electron transfer flavoprotein alpha subunit